MPPCNVQCFKFNRQDLFRQSHIEVTAREIPDKAEKVCANGAAYTKNGLESHKIDVNKAQNCVMVWKLCKMHATRLREWDKE